MKRWKIFNKVTLDTWEADEINIAKFTERLPLMEIGEEIDHKEHWVVKRIK